MSDERVKASVALEAMIREAEQRGRLLQIAEYDALATLSDLKAKGYRNNAEIVRLHAEQYDAEKREFCEEAEAEISAREASEAAALSVPEVAEESVPVSIEHEERYPFAVSYTAAGNVFGSGAYETWDEARADFDRFKSDERYLTIVLKQDSEVIDTFARPIEPADTITIAASEQHAEEAKGEDYLPEGFTRWSSDPHADRGPQPSGDMMVTAWMGGDDFVGPLPAKDFDWEHDTDPVLGYKIDTSGETQGTMMWRAEREASSAFPGGVEVSRETSLLADASQHAEESARAQDIVEPYPQVELDKLVPPLPPLFPPEPPQAATPESLRAGGIVDSEASWWARKLTKEPA